MLHKRSVQLQVLVIMVVALLLLVAGVLAIQITQQREALIESRRQQSLSLVLSFEETVQTTDFLMDQVGQPPADEQMQSVLMQQYEAAFTRFEALDPNIDFVALVLPDGSVLLHSTPRYKNEHIEAIGLADIPLDATVRRDVPDFGTVYLTRQEMSSAGFGTPFDVSLIVGMAAEPIDELVAKSLRSSLLVSGGLMLVIGLAVIYLIYRNLSKPIHAVRVGAHNFSVGQLDYRIPPKGSAEFQLLAETLNQMAGKLQETHQEWEQRYANLETRLQDRARDLEISSEIGRIATSLHDVNKLLRETVEQIRQRFNVIYHAQIFLVDDRNEYAVLVESTGESGQKLLQRGHKLAVGSDSVIGRVTERGLTVIASDTFSGEMPWQPNPLLPDTRAEMALPLTIEDRVIGALDLQSMHPDVFTDDMVTILKVLASQLSIALENARLLAESERRISEIDQLNSRLTRTAWYEFVKAQGRRTASGYLYDQVQIASLDNNSSLMPNRTEADIQIRGEKIGTLVAAMSSEEELSEDGHALVEAVAGRVALAVENARLFQQTQRALAETERLYETARAVSSTSDLSAIYQLVIEQLGTVSYVDNIEVLLSGPDPVLVQYLETVCAWDRDKPSVFATPQDRQWILPMNYTDDAVLPENVPLVYADTSQELPRSHPLYAKLAGISARSVLMAPLNAGGHWFGVLLCTSQQPHVFEASYTAFVSALADQLALAIENRRLFEEAQTEARRARALAEAGQLASQIGGDYEAGLQNLFEAVAGPGHYDRWWFGLLSTDRTQLRQVVSSETGLPRVVRIQRDQNALAEAARIEEIVLVNDPSDYQAVSAEVLEIQEWWGKHIATPVKVGSRMVGVMQIGRGLNEPNLDERDIQLAATLASQVGVATENRRLFDEAESQRQSLQTILDAMPTGVLVVDQTGQIILSNQRLQELLGPQMKVGADQWPESVSLIRSSTRSLYPRDEWPLTRVFQSDSAVLVDDMIVQHVEGPEMSLLANAAPIHDEQGHISAVVGAFQNITELRELERALQKSLNETTLLYDVSRSISRAVNWDELQQITLRMASALLQSAQAHFFLKPDKPKSGAAFELLDSYPPQSLTLDALSKLTSLFVDEAVNLELQDAPAEIGAYMRGAGLEKIFVFPLSVREYVSGWLMLGFAQVRIFTQEERRFIITLTDQAAISADNQRLLLRTQEALQETANLYQASRSIASAQTPRDILQTFVTSAAPVEEALLYLLVGDDPRSPYAIAEVAAHWSKAPAEDRTGGRERLQEFALYEQFVSSDILPLVDSQMCSGVSLPLNMGGRPLGMILLCLPETWKLSDDDIRIYRSLADQATVAIENRRLYQQVQRRARQLSTSAEISRAVTSILQLDELFPQVVDLIRDAFGYDHVQIFMASSDGQDANLVASTGEAGRLLLDHHHSLPIGSRSVVGQATSTGQPQIALDTADEFALHLPNPFLPDTRSEMALPLIARGQILGALDVQSNESGAFTEEDTRALASLADLVATAIDNARLFEVSQQRAEEMSFLFNVTTAATQSPNLDESLQKVVETLYQSLNITNAEIYLPDQSGEYLTMAAEAAGDDTNTDYSAVSAERGLIGWVVRHGEAVLIGDLSRDPRHLRTREGSQSVMAVPLKTASGLAGVLVVESDQLNAFDQNELQLLQTLSGSLAAIVQNSSLLREVQEANERLQEVDRLKMNFLAAMSHELRTPLNSIIGFSRVILKGIDGPLTEMQEQDLTTIYESGKHLLGLVNDILDQAKIEAGKMDLVFAYFRLENVINGVMSTAIGLTRDKPIKLYTEIAENLPDAYGDEFRTRQVLLNLISNASKFTMEGSITVTAFPINEDGRDFIQVSVTDTGIGIAVEDMGLLFEAFQQIDNSTTRAAEGTGVGLPLAKSLTELQGGRIWVASQPGVGSTFSVTIPMTPPLEETPEILEIQPEAKTQVVEAQEADNASQPRLVLVVESNSEVINLYRRYLSRDGYEVLGTTQPEEALELVTVFDPCAVLLEVNIPDHDGWDVLSSLSGSVNTSHVPVIVCSMNANTERGFQLGACDYLVKPFSEDQLLASVRRAVGGMQENN